MFEALQRGTGSKPTSARDWPMKTTPELVTGVDVSDRLSTYVTITTRGDVEEEGRVRTTAPAMRTHFEGAPRRIVLEAGPHSPWISRLLTELGHEVIVANARMVALMKQAARRLRHDHLSSVDAHTAQPRLFSPRGSFGSTPGMNCFLRSRLVNW
jgi:hypothetical protein